ncbi:MAG: capsule assembly Wzi family protein, partial [Bacteroidales bacterium]|nr:capsule assembly Wzi family protein [Bacteroidales bacterium]
LYQYRYINNEWIYSVTKQPKGLDDFFRVVIAKEGSSSSSGSDKAYVAGSQWGAYLLKYDYKLKDKKRLSLYMQHFFDDGSGMTFENYRDNLLGIEYKSLEKEWISGAVFEYVYTKHQTGPIHHNLQMDEEHQHLKNKGNGNDNYYNNVDYVSGPSHFGKSFGTPLFLSPEYNKDGSVYFQSNRIIAFHLGVEGYITSFLQYRVMLTSGQSWGKYYAPYKSVRKGFASQVELIYASQKIQDFEAKLSLGYDNGEFFDGNTFAGGITLSKRGVIFKK